VERKIRGSVLNNWLKYVHRQWGASGLAQCIQALSVHESKFKDGQMYDYALVEELTQWISSAKGMEHVRAGGTFHVTNLGMFAFVVQFLDIKTIAKRGARTFGQLYNFGKAEYDMSPHKGLIARIHEVSTVPEVCEVWIGVLEGMLQVTKKTGTVTKTKCRLKGDPHCEYVVDYE
jgi:hypothetical protein